VMTTDARGWSSVPPALPSRPETDIRGRSFVINWPIDRKVDRQNTICLIHGSVLASPSLNDTLASQPSTFLDFAVSMSSFIVSCGRLDPKTMDDCEPVRVFICSAICLTLVRSAVEMLKI